MAKRIETADDMLNKGNSLFVDEQYEEALEAYTSAIEMEDDHYEAYIKRSATHYALKNYSESIADASKAIQLKPSSADAYLRKGMGLFAESEYESAKVSFEKGKTYAQDAKKFNLWLRKCAAELDEDTSMVVDPKPQQTQQTAQVQTESTESTPTTTQQTASTTSTAATTGTASAAGDSKPAPRFRHEWFQTETHVNVDLFAKKLKKEDLKVVIEEKSLTVTIKLDTGSEFILDLELAAAVVPAESSFEILSTKVEIKLKKKNVAKWKTLESTGEESVGIWDNTHEGKPNPATTYPSSRGAKNWDAIARSDEEEKLSGDHALNKLFRDIFKDGNEEQRRAMMKSYVESNGTVLSTNWDEVGSGEVKGQAPSGMEMHSWTESRDEKSKRGKEWV